MPNERTNELPKLLDGLMGLLSKMYAQDGERSLQELLVNAKVRVVEETGYDNWNGGQWGHNVHLAVSENFLLPYLRNKNDVGQRIRNELNALSDIQDEYFENVFLELEDDPNADWRQDSGLLLATGKSVPAGAEQRIWRDGGFRVFLSHKNDVKRQVGELKEKLTPYGVSSFVAHEDIHPTQEWQNEIEVALGTADAFIAVLTEGFHDSLWTDQEVGYALARGIPIIALRLGRDPYGFIGKFQALTCEWASAPSEIMKILIKQDRMVGAYIEGVRNARSFQEGNTLADLLPLIEKINEESAQGLVDAYNGNQEVRGSFGFNGLKPTIYGKGLVLHLERLGIDGYEYKEFRTIERKTPASESG